MTNRPQPPKARDPFTAAAPGRHCERCGRGGGVTLYFGRRLHPKCAKLEQAENNLVPAAHRRGDAGKP